MTFGPRRGRAGRASGRRGGPGKWASTVRFSTPAGARERRPCRQTGSAPIRCRLPILRREPVGLSKSRLLLISLVALLRACDPATDGGQTPGDRRYELDQELMSKPARAQGMLEQGMSESITIGDSFLKVRSPLTGVLDRASMPASTAWVLHCGVGVSVNFLATVRRGPQSISPTSFSTRQPATTSRPKTRAQGRVADGPLRAVAATFLSMVPRTRALSGH